MKFRKDKSGLYLLRIDKGESIRECVEQFSASVGLLGAGIQGIGAVQDPELGYIVPEKKIYERRQFTGLWELVSFIGNIALKDEKHFLHAHVVLCGHDYQVVGGHLFDARVSALCELVATPFQDRLGRAENTHLGAYEWDIA